MEDSSSGVVSYAVNDPSHRKAGSYWQWHSGAHDNSWDVIANAVAAGWPSIADALASPRSELYGIVDGPRRWLYRVFPAGRDSFGRPGRYFTVVFLLHRPEDCLDPSVAGVLAYFEGERSLPLDCSALERGVPSGTPSETLRKLVSLWAAGGQGNHWGIDGTGSTRRFKDLEGLSAATRPPVYLPSDKGKEATSRTGSPSEDRHRLPLVVCFVAGLALGSVGGFLGGYRIAQVGQGWARAKERQQKTSVPGVSVPDVATESPGTRSTQSQVHTPQETEGDSGKQ